MLGKPPQCLLLECSGFRRGWFVKTLLRLLFFPANARTVNYDFQYPLGRCNIILPVNCRRKPLWPDFMSNPRMAIMSAIIKPGLPARWQTRSDISVAIAIPVSRSRRAVSCQSAIIATAGASLPSRSLPWCFLHRMIRKAQIH